ncbi:uracil nucleotide/cysteinyl leukotriene receptor [Girardinichthys multiradiatus]|uniref:uracil nucleotide/cysteinyl leukotriene receptor n=1 Tax=Girardinichthys multiradiatus TaxID=208333 RepID=UPI001FAE27F0|nr:uracil nucleotide/cysteinyl leukotriene receptor [Girardinichthys multiradiatus]
MTAMNISNWDETEGLYRTTLPLWDVILSMFYILIFFIAVPGNVLALWAFCHQKGTSPSKVFLRNLSIADICYVLILPMRIVYHLSDNHWPFGNILCQLSGFLFYLNMYCSLYLMSFISLDRLLAVILPLRSQFVRKPLYANISVAILWVMVIVSMIPSLFSKKNQDNSANNCSMLYLERTSSKALISTMVAFLIPFSTIVITYVVILLKLRNLKQQEERPVKDKAVKMIILVVMNFLFAFVPYHICRIIYAQRIGGSMESLKRANQITSALTCISGVLDPVMYFFLNKMYRNTFLHLFCKTRRCDLSV